MINDDDQWLMIDAYDHCYDYDNDGDMFIYILIDMVWLTVIDIKIQFSFLDLLLEDEDTLFYSKWWFRLEINYSTCIISWFDFSKTSSSVDKANTTTRLTGIIIYLFSFRSTKIRATVDLSCWMFCRSHNESLWSKQKPPKLLRRRTSTLLKKERESGLHQIPKWTQTHSMLLLHLLTQRSPSRLHQSPGSEELRSSESSS